MGTKELPIEVEKDDTPQPFSKNFDQFGNSSEFIFDVCLSTAVAADGKNKERVPKPKGPLPPEMLDKMNRTGGQQATAGHACHTRCTKAARSAKCLRFLGSGT